MKLRIPYFIANAVGSLSKRAPPAEVIQTIRLMNDRGSELAMKVSNKIIK